MGGFRFGGMGALLLLLCVGCAAMADPFSLDADMLADVDRVVGFSGTPEERLRRLLRYVKDDSFLHFRYESANRSFTAREAYRAPQGDCVSFALLYAAFARHLDVPVSFVYVHNLDGYFEKNGLFDLSSHVAVGYRSGLLASVARVRSPVCASSLRRGNLSLTYAASSPSLVLVEERSRSILFLTWRASVGEMPLCLGG